MLIASQQSQQNGYNSGFLSTNESLNVYKHNHYMDCASPWINKLQLAIKLPEDVQDVLESVYKKLYIYFDQFKGRKDLDYLPLLTFSTNNNQIAAITDTLSDSFEAAGPFEVNIKGVRAQGLKEGGSLVFDVNGLGNIKELLSGLLDLGEQRLRKLIRDVINENFNLVPVAEGLTQQQQQFLSGVMENGKYDFNFSVKEISLLRLENTGNPTVVKGFCL